ncbi:MAG: type I-E CRISPR-associated protein Cse1/CasA, partial [Allobaculum sp.]|nr:type I-E CRISPR-associated protein Cse1/CasA [Allobaculum sp.]
MNKDLYDVSLEPWITVENLDGTLSQVGFQELLIQASNYRRLISETPAQGSAIFRQCLAIAHYLISQYELDGTKQELEEEDLQEALDRWAAYWNAGKIPENIVIQYFNQNRSTFNLIDEKRPFMQVPMAKRGTYYNVSKMTEAESSNKSRLFSMRSGSEKETISLAEGATWLYAAIGFDDTSGKPSKLGKKQAEEHGTKIPSPGCGWLGKIGAIYPQGKNLFETILLNLPLINEQELVWPPDRFCWDSPQERWRERNHISKPKSFSELMTLYSRFILFDLDRENQRIKGYWLLGGEFFDKENCNEPFTLWKPVKVKTGEVGQFTPKRHTETRQAWRNFSEIVNPARDQSTRQPGIVEWIKLLEEEGLLPENYPIHFEMPFVSYGDKDFFITNTSAQSLEFYPSLLMD